MSYLNGLRVRIEGPIVFWPSTVSGIFQLKIFLKGLHKTEKLVEWRKGRKPWPVHRARIIDVASMLHANFS